MAEERGANAQEGQRKSVSLRNVDERLKRLQERVEALEEKVHGEDYGEGN